MNVTVVGAGLAGLLTAAELKRRGVDVTVLEAGGSVGGVARTDTVDGYLLEPAVGSLLLPHPALTPILQAAAIDVTPQAGTADRYYSDGDGFSAIPHDPGAFFTSPSISARGKLRAVAEPLIRSKTNPTESLAGFLIRRLGKEVGSITAEFAAAGVFGGNPHRIDAAAYPPLIKLEGTYGSLLQGMIARRKASQANPSPRPMNHFPTAGMRQLSTDLADFVGDVRLDSPVASVETGSPNLRIDGMSCDAVVLACPPDRAPLLDGRIPPMEHPERLAVAVVFLGGTTDEIPSPEGFGLLTSSRAATPILGVILNNGPAATPPDHRLLKVLVGGWRAAIDTWSDEDLVTRTISDLNRVFGATIRPGLRHVERQTIPQYSPGHATRIATAFWPDRVFTTGWTQRGIGLSSLALDAVRVADQVEELNR